MKTQYLILFVILNGFSIQAQDYYAKKRTNKAPISGISKLTVYKKNISNFDLVVFNPKLIDESSISSIKKYGSNGFIERIEYYHNDTLRSAYNITYKNGIIVSQIADEDIGCRFEREILYTYEKGNRTKRTYINCDSSIYYQVERRDTIGNLIEICFINSNNDTTNMLSYSYNELNQINRKVHSSGYRKKYKDEVWIYDSDYKLKSKTYYNRDGEIIKKENIKYNSQNDIEVYSEQFEHKYLKTRIVEYKNNEGILIQKYEYRNLYGEEESWVTTYVYK